MTKDKKVSFNISDGGPTTYAVGHTQNHQSPLHAYSNGCLGTHCRCAFGESQTPESKDPRTGKPKLNTSHHTPSRVISCNRCHARTVVVTLYL